MHKLKLFSNLLIIIALTAAIGCSKSTPADTPTPVTPVTLTTPTVTLMPAKALPNSAISIVGTGFTTDVSKILVTFNNNTATVYSATATEIVVGVPANAQNGKVVVVSDGTTYNSSADFTVTTGTQSTWSTGPMFVATIDALGNIYGGSGPLVYKLTTSTAVTSPATFAGTTSSGAFSLIYGIVVDAAGNVYVADPNKHVISKITPAGVVSVLAGGGGGGFVDGQGTVAKFSGPYGLTIDASGNLYTTDFILVRKITPSGLVSTIAGTTQGGPGYVDGIGTAARFSNLWNPTIDAAGNLYVADNYNIRKITQTGVVSTIAGNGSSGNTNGLGTTAKFLSPGYVAADAAGNIFVVDDDGSASASIRMINKVGMVSNFLKIVQTKTALVNGTLANATAYSPWGITFDAAGNMYICNAGVLSKITFN